MRKSALRDVPVYAAESLDRDRLLFALRVDDILQRDPDFDLDELLIYRNKRDDLWTQEIRDKNGNTVEGVVPGYVSIGDMLLGIYGTNVAQAGRHDVIIRAFADLYWDKDSYIDDVAEVIDGLADIDEVASAIEADIAEEKEKQDQRREKIEEARRRIDGDS